MTLLIAYCQLNAFYWKQLPGGDVNNCAFSFGGQM